MWLVVANFTLVTGSLGVSVLLGLIPVAALLAGPVAGQRRRSDRRSRRG
jgi:hypothetical protein